MHIVTILAYAILFWRASGPIGHAPPFQADGALTLGIVLLQPLVLWALARLLARNLQARLLREDSGARALQLYHRAILGLRIALIAGFGFNVFATSWPDWFEFRRVTPELQILGDLLVLAPFVGGAFAIWLGTFPIERTIRLMGRLALKGVEPPGKDWTVGRYLDFNARHQLLVIAVPMTIILFAANVAYGYEAQLRRLTGFVWSPDVLLGAVAGLVFIAAPIMLRRIWRTTPLADDPLRRQLEGLCQNIGLKVRDILVWQTDGLMINAAVMGVFAPVRYVLLSDALLSTMTATQVEAVFGHEAGHVRHHHIPYFLAFALIGWLMAAGVMEFSAIMAYAWAADPRQWLGVVETLGVLVTLAFWGLGFGWLSRRFEWQADMFAASCVAAMNGCDQPCSVHLHPGAPTGGARVCSSGALAFASALERVALLSGIPRDEPSWRHSSIGNRIRFLLSMANDPERARRFDRLVRRVKGTMAAAALVGSAATVLYWRAVPRPAVLKLQIRDSSAAINRP
jgi:STE24 endopeptidase